MARSPLGSKIRYFLHVYSTDCFDTPGHRQRCGGFKRLRHATDPDVFAKFFDVFAKFFDVFVESGAQFFFEI